MGQMHHRFMIYGYFVVMDVTINRFQEKMFKVFFTIHGRSRHLVNVEASFRICHCFAQQFQNRFLNIMYNDDCDDGC